MLILGHLGLLDRISQLRTREVGRVLGARPLLSLAAFLSLLFAVLCHENAPRLDEADGELAVLQSPRVAYRGQIVAAVIADTLEAAREGAARVEIAYDEEPARVVLEAGDPALYAPPKVNPSFETDTEAGDVDAALKAAAVIVDETYETPAFHNNPMEPHATIATWEAEGSRCTTRRRVRLPRGTRSPALFGLEPSQVRVIAPHVGGGFGSKGTPRPHVVVAAMAARVAERPVKLAVTRQQMFAITGYRTPTIQRLRLAAGRDGRLTAIAHDVVEQTSTRRRVRRADRGRDTHALRGSKPSHEPSPRCARRPDAVLDAGARRVSRDVRARVGDRRARLRPPASTRSSCGCATSPASIPRPACRSRAATSSPVCAKAPSALAGMRDRRAPALRREGDWLLGTGVAASTYPARRRPSQALARREPGGRYVVQVAAADIGTGARTVLTQIAADALGVAADDVRLEIGDSCLPSAPVAGGSMGTASWGSAVVKACAELSRRRGERRRRTPPRTSKRTSRTPVTGSARSSPRCASTRCTGEIRVARMLGVFATGTIVNPRTARSQFIGGMTMGIGMALLEESTIDRRYGDYVNHDLASYHVPTYADVPDLEATWIDEDDEHLNPMGSKGIGEIGIVGARRRHRQRCPRRDRSALPPPADQARRRARGACRGNDQARAGYGRLEIACLDRVGRTRACAPSHAVGGGLVLRSP